MKTISRTLKILATATLLLVLIQSQAYAQDPTEVDSDHYSLIFENEQVRVLRINYGPSEKSVMHYHPNGVVIYMRNSQGQFTLPDGTVVESSGEIGDVIWAPAGLHLPENVSDSEEIYVILVELKSHDAEDQ